MMLLLYTTNNTTTESQSQSEKKMNTTAIKETTKKTTEAQTECYLVEKAYIYLTKGEQPSESTKNDKRSILSKQVRFITDPRERSKILEACHRDKTAGHMRTKKHQRRSLKGLYGLA